MPKECRNWKIYDVKLKGAAEAHEIRWQTENAAESWMSLN